MDRCCSRLFEVAAKGMRERVSGKGCLSPRIIGKKERVVEWMNTSYTSIATPPLPGCRYTDKPTSSSPLSWTCWPTITTASTTRSPAWRYKSSPYSQHPKLEWNPNPQTLPLHNQPEVVPKRRSPRALHQAGSHRSWSNLLWQRNRQ